MFIKKANITQFHGLKLVNLDFFYIKTGVYLNTVSSTVAPTVNVYFVKNLGGEATCDHFSYVEYIPEKWEEKTFLKKSEGNMGCARVL